MTPLQKLATELDTCERERQKGEFIKRNRELVAQAFNPFQLEHPTDEEVMQILFSKHRCRILNSTGLLICQILEAERKAA